LASGRAPAFNAHAIAAADGHLARQRARGTKTLGRYFHDDNADFLATALPVAAARLPIVNTSGANLTIKAPP
jgi:hypothetical protein